MSPLKGAFGFYLQVPSAYALGSIISPFGLGAHVLFPDGQWGEEKVE